MTPKSISVIVILFVFAIYCSERRDGKGKSAVLENRSLSGAGGILYLIFQDIAPQAKLKNRWAPALGAVAGFLLGVIGRMIAYANTG